MDGFVLVDLFSQLDAVVNHVAGWERQRILTWIAEQGELREIPGLDDTFSFQSPVGLSTHFRFSDRRLVILGDHQVVAVATIPDRLG